ncbi:hypothetical protein DYB28_008985, partial [Aphanomyces astaci]
DWVRKNFSLKNGHRVEDLLSAWLADEPSLYAKHLEAVCLIFDTPSAPSLPLLEGRIFGKAPDDSTLDLPWTRDSLLGRSPTSSEDGPRGSTKVTTADEEEDEAKSGGNVADEEEKEEAASVGAIADSEQVDRAISSRLLVKETLLSRTPTRKRATTNPPGMRSPKKPRVVMSDTGRGLPTMGLISSVEVAYQDLVRRAPWERYRTQVSFIPPSFLADPMWGDFQAALDDFWRIHARAVWNRIFLPRSSTTAETEVNQTLEPLVGLAGHLYRVSRAHGLSLLHYLYGPGSRRIRRFGLRADARDKLWPEVPLRVKGQAWRAPFMPTLEFVYGRDLTVRQCQAFDPDRTVPFDEAEVKEALAWMLE